MTRLHALFAHALFAAALAPLVSAQSPSPGYTIYTALNQPNAFLVDNNDQVASF